MKRRSASLIKSPLTWQVADALAAPPAIAVLAKRGAAQPKTPRATILIDAREQNPCDFSRFEGCLRVSRKTSHLYHWLENNDFGRFLADEDL